MKESFSLVSCTLRNLVSRFSNFDNKTFTRIGNVQFRVPCRYFWTKKTKDKVERQLYRIGECKTFGRMCVAGISEFISIV